MLANFAIAIKLSYGPHNTHIFTKQNVYCHYGIKHGREEKRKIQDIQVCFYWLFILTIQKNYLMAKRNLWSILFASALIQIISEV